MALNEFLELAGKTEIEFLQANLNNLPTHSYPLVHRIGATNPHFSRLSEID